MRKRNVIFIDEHGLKEAWESGILVVYRPMGSKIFRAFVPDRLRIHQEVMDLLLLWSKGIQKNGVFFIRATEEEIVNEFGQTLWFMNMHEIIIGVPNEDTWKHKNLN